MSTRSPQVASPRKALHLVLGQNLSLQVFFPGFRVEINLTAG